MHLFAFSSQYSAVPPIQIVRGGTTAKTIFEITKLDAKMKWIVRIQILFKQTEVCYSVKDIRIDPEVDCQLQATYLLIL